MPAAIQLALTVKFPTWHWSGEEQTLGNDEMTTVVPPTVGPAAGDREGAIVDDTYSKATPDEE